MRLAARVLLLLQVLIALPVLGGGAGTNAASPPLVQQAYVWQRAWNDSVQQAVRDHGGAFDRLVALGAEVSWKERRPQVTRMPIRFSALAAGGRPIGLALRIGPCPGPFARHGAVTDFLTSLAESLIAEAKAHQVAVSELQIDFDCAASKLDGYRLWVEALREKAAPLPVIITALPAWLDQPGFKSLVSTADGYVLQVHSLERPRDITAPFTLCDAQAARRAVERASRLPVPFRVALPTYGYVVAFDSKGHFTGLAAEGTAKSWPAGTQLREVRSDPLEMAELVREWTARRPPGLRGIIWYRLPIKSDILNWRWPTLGAIVSSRFPRTSARAEARRVEAGLVEISLVNDGELDISSRLAVEARWPREGGVRLVAGDALRGFDMVDAGSSTASFQTTSQPYRLPAGERQVIGWLRLNEDREVQVELKFSDAGAVKKDRPAK